jgi:methionyl-tRNA formyltransferase
MTKINTIFMGNPDFCLPALENLHQNPNVNLSLICGGLDKKVGRGQKLTSPATIQFAKKNNLNYIQSENINKSEDFFDICSNLNVDIIVVFAFSHFLGKKILNIPKTGCFNIHTSLLPKYRGSSPIHYALLNGDEQTGISIQKMVKKMDAGDVLISKKIELLESDDFQTLCNKFQVMLPEFVSRFIEVLTKVELSFTSQNESEVSFAPLIKKEDGFIDPLNDNFEKVRNKIRALKIWPGVYIFLNHQRYKIHQVKESLVTLSPGVFKIMNKEIFLGLKDRTASIVLIQPPGKKPMASADFINGCSDSTTFNLTDPKKDDIK